MSYSADSWSGYWDGVTGRLHLPCGVTFQRKDLQVMHWLVRGVPRKVMAQQLSVSVKTVEKRLARCRQVFVEVGIHDYTLQGQLYQLGLMAFLIEYEEAFFGKKTRPLSGPSHQLKSSSG